jgi:hypothetical protein
MTTEKKYRIRSLLPGDGWEVGFFDRNPERPEEDGERY